MLLNSKIQDSEPGAAEKSPLLNVKSGRTGLPRDAAIDFTKGTLVLFMVLYHWLNYFVGPQGHYYNYLRFLTPSFIFISGFMISRIQLSRYGFDAWHLSKR